MRIGFDDTAPGVSVIPIRESADHLDFSVTAKTESVQFFVEQVQVAGGGDGSSPETTLIP